MTFLDLIFPKTCLKCGKTGQYICQNCLNKVQTLNPCCPYCEKKSIDGFTHSKCKKNLGLDGLCSVWKYEGIVKKAIQTLKYKYATEIVQELCGYFMPELIKLEVQNLISGDFYLVPTPVYWYRRNFRGFNQSELIGKNVSELFGCKFIPDFLVKNKPTISQVELSVKARKKNLHGVFSLNPNYELSTPYSVLIFDDVFTTGSTLHEAAKVLKQAGVNKVWGMTMAR